MKKIIFLIFILGTLFCKAQDYRYSKDSVKLKWDLFTEFHSLSEDAHRINRKIVFKDTLNADSLVVTYYRSGGVYEKLFYKDGIAKTERYYPNSNIYQIYYAKDRAIIFKPYYTWTNYVNLGILLYVRFGLTINPLLIMLQLNMSLLN